MFRVTSSLRPLAGLACVFSALVLVAGSAAGVGSAQRWQAPLPGYAYEPVTACPLPERTTRVYRVCEDQMAIFAEGLAKARAEKKLLIVNFGATWCGWCHLLHEVMPTEAVLGHRSAEIDFAATYHSVDIGLSTTDQGKRVPVVSGQAVKRMILAQLPKLEIRVVPFIAIVDPNDMTMTQAHTLGDYVVHHGNKSSYDPVRLRGLLRDAHDRIRPAI